VGGCNIVTDRRFKASDDIVKALSLHGNIEIDANSFPIAGPSACKTNKVAHVILHVLPAYLWDN
jgi:hypothetical protein